MRFERSHRIVDVSRMSSDGEAPHEQYQHWGYAMAWKATGHPTVGKQRDTWVVRVDGIDFATRRHRRR